MKKILLTLFFASSFARSESLCPKLNYEGLLKELKGKDDIKIVFFASWCGGCKAHLKESDSQPSILISVFDEDQLSEDIVKKMNLKSKCFISDKIEDTLKISSLPKTLLWKNGKVN